VQARCRGAAIAPPPPVSADTAHGAPAHPAAPAAPPSRAKPPAEHGGYAVQVGAFSTRAEGDAAVRKFAAKGVTARVVGTKAPYRVWIGRYRTRALAESERKTLAAQGTTGFVTEAEP
jgi:cell division protein FtsN